MYKSISAEIYSCHTLNFDKERIKLLFKKFKSIIEDHGIGGLRIVEITFIINKGEISSFSLKINLYLVIVI